MKRCLWVLPKGIFPVKDGASVANQSLIKSFRSYTQELDIIVFNEDQKDESFASLYESEFNSTNVFFLRRGSFKNKIKKTFFILISFMKAPHLPVTTGYYNTDKLQSQIKKILTQNSYDLIVFDCLHPYVAFMDLPEFKNTPVVYRAHNVEGDLWFTAAAKTKNHIIKNLLNWQGRKMTDFQLALVKRSKVVWNIAEEDLKEFKLLLSGDESKLAVIPVGLDFKKSKVLKESILNEPLKLLFLGKMDWAPNTDGLKWFLQEVWPHVDHRKLELHIVGSGNASWGTELFKSPGVKFFGFVSDLNAAYASADFSIIPIRYGSGTRIKVIESISKGLPIISSDMGVQGSGLVDFYHAETATEWIKVLSRINKADGQIMAEAAFKKLEVIYSPKMIGEKAYQSIKN